MRFIFVNITVLLMKYSFFIPLFVFNLSLFSQNLEIGSNFGVEQKKQPKSNITKVYASKFEKVTLKEALYDYKRNNLPYYLASKDLSSNLMAIGSLKVISTVILDAATSSIMTAISSKITNIPVAIFL